MASRVLLIDPDPISRKLRSRLLNDSGYAVFPARNQQDAIDRIKPGRYQVVLVAGDENEAVRCCHQIRRMNPAQVVIVIAETSTYIPSGSCPDELLRSGGPEQVLRSVRAALQSSQLGHQ